MTTYAFTPTTIKEFFTNPIIKAEMVYLRRQLRERNRWLQRLEGLMFFAAFVVATMPLWVYMSDVPKTYILMPIMLLVIFALHLNYTMRTLFFASHSISRELQTGEWDNLILTGLDARRIILYKWWAVMRLIWFPHLIISLFKFGIIYGLAQYFYTVNLGGCYQHFGMAMCYTSNYYHAGGYGRSFVVLSAIFLTGIFGLAEAGLLTSLGLFSSLLTPKHRLGGFVLSILFRSVLVFFAGGAWFLFSYLGWRILNGAWLYPYNYSPSYGLVTNHELRQLIAAIQFTISTLGDNGIMVLTDFMRPRWELAHIFRRGVNALYGLTIYGFLIWTLLKGAQKLAVRQSALRPLE